MFLPSLRLLFRVLCVALLGLVLQPAWSQQIKVETSLDSVDILIGQQVQLHCKITCPRNSPVIFPEFANDSLMPGIEVVQKSKIDTLFTEDGKNWQLLRNYTLTAFDSAVYALPRFSVQCGKKDFRTTNDLVLKVGFPALDKQKPDELHPPHAPTNALFQWSLRSPLLFLCLQGLAVLFFYSLYSVCNKKLRLKKVWVYPPPSPHKVAYKALQHLQESSFTPEVSKNFFMQLSDVLRLYLKKRFDFDATEMTSREILAHLQNLPLQHTHTLYRFFEICDWVKFAQYPATQLDWQEALRTALSYVDDTKLEDPEAEKAQLVEVPYEARLQVYLRRAHLLLILISIIGLFFVWGMMLVQLWQDFV